MNLQDLINLKVNNLFVYRGKLQKVLSTHFSEEVIDKDKSGAPVYLRFFHFTFQDEGGIKIGLSSYFPYPEKLELKDFDIQHCAKLPDARPKLKR